MKETTPCEMRRGKLFVIGFHSVRHEAIRRVSGAELYPWVDISAVITDNVCCRCARFDDVGSPLKLEDQTEKQTARICKRSSSCGTTDNAEVTRHALKGNNNSGTSQNFNKLFWSGEKKTKQKTKLFFSPSTDIHVVKTRTSKQHEDLGQVLTESQPVQNIAQRSSFFFIILPCGGRQTRWANCQLWWDPLYHHPTGPP